MEEFSALGSENLFIYWWEQAPKTRIMLGLDGEKGNTDPREKYSRQIMSGSAEENFYVLKRRGVNGSGISAEESDLGLFRAPALTYVSGDPPITTFANVFGGEGNPPVTIEFISAKSDRVTYRLKIKATKENEQKILAKNLAEDKKISAGVKSAKVADGKRFTLAGARFSWDVGDNNELWLSHEVILSSAGELEFGVAQQNELESLDLSSINFRALPSKPLKFPLNRVAVFRTSKGCFALKPIKVENGGKVVRESETIVTKMVTYEWRSGLGTEPEEVARRVTQR